MRVLGLIPARGGSIGIPSKNIKLLNGLPLIAYSIMQAKQAERIDRVIVSTDDYEIKSVAENYGAEVPFLRPAELATSSASSLDVILHALNWLQEHDELYDVVCLLQPTSPYRPNGIIDLAIEEFQVSGVDSLVSLRKVPDHYNPFWTFIKDESGQFKTTISGNLIPRRQELPLAYHRDGAIYLLSVDQMLKEGTLLGERIGGVEIPSPELINIDTYQDWLLAEKHMKDVADC